MQDLVSIDYPAVVKNIPNMIETLGGSENLSDIICDEKRKIQLWFRPKDRLSKPLTGVRKPLNAVLVKIRVKKKSKKVVSQEVIAHVREEFSFSSMADFQFLAMDKGVNSYNKIIPAGLDPEWLKSDDAPYILVPGQFSKIEATPGYYFAKEKSGIGPGGEVRPEIITSNRPKRRGLAKFISYDAEGDVPAGPAKLPSASLAASQDMIRLKKLFAERPVLSRCAMSGAANISQKVLRTIAPYVAYHFHNGPWRAMWVRFGYDPRKDPAAKIYQTLDFRIQRVEDEGLVGKDGPRFKRRFIDKELPSSSYILKPGKVPPSRQFFYQYCDVELPEVQALLAAVEVRSECHPTDGWMPQGTSFACRRIIKQYVLDATDQGKSQVADLSDSSVYSGADDFSDSDDTQDKSDGKKTN